MINICEVETARSAPQHSFAGKLIRAEADPSAVEMVDSGGEKWQDEMHCQSCGSQSAFRRHGFAGVALQAKLLSGRTEVTFLIKCIAPPQGLPTLPVCFVAMSSYQICPSSPAISYVYEAHVRCTLKYCVNFS